MTFRAHYDGRVLIPDEPVDLPEGEPLELQVINGKTAVPEKSSQEKRPLVKLARLAEKFPEDPNWPVDGAAQHDHYLYGTPKHEP